MPLSAPTVRSLRNYRTVVGWVLRDAVWRFKGRVMGLVALGGLGVLLQASALAGALGYARLLEGGRPVGLLEWQFDPRTDVELLVIVAGGITIALLAAGYFLYRFRSGAISLGRHYEAVRIRETLNGAARLPHPDAPEAARFLDEVQLGQVQRDSRLCGRVLRKTVEAFVPLLAVPAAGTALLVLNPWLTLLLGAVTGGAGVFLFRINRRGAQASERMERMAKPAMRDRKDAVAHLLGEDLEAAVPGAGVRDVAEEKHVRRHLDAYADRLQAVEDSGFTTSIVTAFSLGAILLLEGRAVLTGGSSLSGLLAYLVLLRVFLTRFMSFMRSVSAVSRFYPQLKRHFGFAQAARPATRTEAEGAEFPAELQLPALHLEEEGKWAPLERGERAGLVVDGQLTRKALTGLSSAIRPLDDARGVAGHVRLVGASRLDAGDGTMAGLGFAPDVSPSRLRSQLEKLGASQTSRLLVTDETAAGSTARHELGPEDTFFLSFLAAASWQPHLLIVDAQRWQSLNEGQREHLDGIAKNTVLTFSCQTRDLAAELEIGLVVFTDSNAPIGWVPTDHLDDGYPASSGRPGRPEPRGTASLEDEDDEQDEDDVL